MRQGKENMVAGKYRAVRWDIRGSIIAEWFGQAKSDDDACSQLAIHLSRTAQADVLFDEILKIADTPDIGVKTVTKASGVETIEGDMIEHRRLQIDARKWIAARLAPKKYGDKQAIEHSGPDGKPIRPVIALTDDMRARALLMFAEKTGFRLVKRDPADE
jgi:hypothetical protein